MPENTGWTLDTLERHLSEKIEALKELIKLAIEGAERANTKSDNAIEKRLDIMNEFRGALGDQTNKLLPRSEYEPAHQTVMDAVNELRQRITAMEAELRGKQQGLSSIGALTLGIIAGMALIVSIVTALVHYSGH